MQVGDKVILSAVGMRKYMGDPDNPINTLGVIDTIYNEIEFKFHVTWSNGESNLYMREDLKVIQC